MKEPDFEETKHKYFAEQDGELTLAQVQTRHILN